MFVRRPGYLEGAILPIGWFYHERGRLLATTCKRHYQIYRNAAARSVSSNPAAAANVRNRTAENKRLYSASKHEFGTNKKSTQKVNHSAARAKPISRQNEGGGGGQAKGGEEAACSTVQQCRVSTKKQMCWPSLEFLLGRYRFPRELHCSIWASDLLNSL